MAATGVRVTMFLRDGAYGITEAHVLVAATTIEAARVPAQNLLKKRLKIAAAGVIPVKVRMSKEGVFRDSRILGQDFLAGITGRAVVLGDPGGVGLDNFTDQAKAAYQLRLESGDLHRTPLYLAGIPDYVCRFGADTAPIPPPPAWVNDLELYKKELLKGWGYVGRAEAVGALAPRGVVKVSTEVATGLFQIITQAAGAPYVSGQKVQLRNFTLSNNAFVTPNGRWQISLVEPDSPVAGQIRYTLRNSSGININTLVNLGTVEPVDFTTYAYDNIEDIGPTTRKRGNRFLTPAGRRTIRKRISA